MSCEYRDISKIVVLYGNDAIEGARDTHYYTSLYSASRNENKWVTHWLLYC